MSEVGGIEQAVGRKRWVRNKGREGGKKSFLRQTVHLTKYACL